MIVAGKVESLANAAWCAVMMVDGRLLRKSKQDDDIVLPQVAYRIATVPFSSGEKEEKPPQLLLRQK